MSSSREQRRNECILASDFDDRQRLMERIERLERENNALRHHHGKSNEKKTLSCNGCRTAIEDKRAFWCQTCSERLTFDVGDLLDHEKHTKAICLDCAIHEHNEHTLVNYFQQLIRSCSNDFPAMRKHSSDLATNWPLPAISFSSYLKNFFKEQFEKSEEILKRSKSRDAYKQFNDTSRAIFEKAEKNVDDIRTHIAEFVKNIEECGDEFEILRSNGELFFSVAESEANSKGAFIQEPPLKFGVQPKKASHGGTAPESANALPSGQLVQWNVNWQFPLDINIVAVSMSADDLVILTSTQLFHAQHNEPKAHVPTTMKPHLLFTKYPFVPLDEGFRFHSTISKLVPNHKTVVFVNGASQKELIIYNFSEGATKQKIKVQFDIGYIDCSETVIVVGPDGRKGNLGNYVINNQSKVLLFTWDAEAGQCSKPTELRTRLNGPESRITFSGILAYLDDRDVLQIYNVTDRTRIGQISCRLDSMAISPSGSTIIGEQDGQLYFIKPTFSTYTPMGSAVKGLKLLKAVSDGTRNVSAVIKTNKGYSIVTFNNVTDYVTSNPYTIHNLEGDAFEESFVFLNVNRVLHLQYVSKCVIDRRTRSSGTLMRYRYNDLHGNFQGTWDRI